MRNLRALIAGALDPTRAFERGSLVRGDFSLDNHDMNSLNRRRFERFSVLPMYTPVIVRLLGENAAEHQGHVYDISEGGVRFELDEPIAPGTPVAIQIVLPGDHRSGADRGVLVQGNIVWTNDDADEPGPTRMAAAFTRFSRAGDRERLMNQLSSGRYARAA